MKTIFDRLACVVLFLTCGPSGRAQQESSAMGFVRVVHAVSAGEGMANILIDGHDLYPAGYRLGQKTGALALEVGRHVITLRKAGVRSGTVKLSVKAGESFTLIGFAEKVPAQNLAELPRWQTRLLRLDVAEPENSGCVTLVSLCPQNEIEVGAASRGALHLETLHLKRLVVTRMTRGKFRADLGFKVAGEVLAIVPVEDFGNHEVVFYQDADGKTQAILLDDSRWNVAG